MVVDVHAHVFPDRIAADAVPALAEEAGIAADHPGTCATLLASMDRAGVDVSWLQPVATKPEQIESINHWLYEKRSPRFVTFGAIHPDHADLPELIHELAARDFPGVKIHSEYHKIGPEDERLFPMYEALIEEKMLALFHAGVDIGIPTVNSTPQRFRTTIERFPELRVILAHMGGFQQWEDVSEYIAGTDVYLDTSYVFGHMPDEQFLDIVETHGPERVLFGTDTPWASQHDTLQHLQSLPLPADVLDRICTQNAEALLAGT